MTESEIQKLMTAANAGPVLWLSPSDEYYLIKGFTRMPAYDGDPAPELSALFAGQTGWAALDGCEAKDFYLLSALFSEQECCCGETDDSWKLCPQHGTHNA